MGKYSKENIISMVRDEDVEFIRMKCRGDIPVVPKIYRSEMGSRLIS